MPGALVLLVAFGIVALLVAFSRWLAHRPAAVAGNVAIALLLFGIAVGFGPAATHLRTYQRLRASEMVAQVYCERTGPGTWSVTFTRLPGGRIQVYEMAGDEWRLAARTLIWQGRAVQLGLHPDFRFERLESRFLEPSPPVRKKAAAANQVDRPRLPRSYALPDDGQAGTDVWSQARARAWRWRGLLEAGLVSHPWRPLAVGARFDVWIRLSPGAAEASLDARPANEAGIRAMRYTESRDNSVRTEQG